VEADRRVPLDEGGADHRRDSRRSLRIVKKRWAINLLALYGLLHLIDAALENLK
jgi:hypothetical protein